jgi:hypothetical protein
MAQQKIGTMFKRRRILEGHLSPIDYYPKKKNSTLHNLKNWNLPSSTLPKKIAFFLLLNHLHIVFPLSHPSAPLKT